MQLLVTIFSPWQWFCSTRTLSNSLETVLTIAALNYWPWALYGDAGAAPSGSAGEVATKEATDESEGSQIFKSHADTKR
jgi:phosphatidylinositol glycan class B